MRSLKFTLRLCSFNTRNQNPSNSSLLISYISTRPTIGNTTGWVMATLLRGYLKMAPPKETSCSIVRYLRPCSLAANVADRPAGPAPTMMTSKSLPLFFFVSIESIACLPCTAALRINPMPPSSPAIKMFETLVSKVGATKGISMPRFSVPNTSCIASTGQASRQAPWPIQCVGSVSTALPLIKLSAFSGHALTHAPEPQHLAKSMTGWMDAGSVKPDSFASCNRSRPRRLSFL